MKAAREISLAVFYIEYQCDSEILEILETVRVNFRKVSGKASAFRLRCRGLLAVGRVLSQRVAKCATRLSRQPARSHRRQPPSTPSSSFRVEVNFFSSIS